MKHGSGVFVDPTDHLPRELRELRGPELGVHRDVVLQRVQGAPNAHARGVQGLRQVEAFHQAKRAQRLALSHDVVAKKRLAPAL